MIVFFRRREPSERAEFPDAFGLVVLLERLVDELSGGECALWTAVVKDVRLGSRRPAVVRGLLQPLQNLADRDNNSCTLSRNVLAVLEVGEFALQPGMLLVNRWLQCGDEPELSV